MICFFYDIDVVKRRGSGDFLLCGVGGEFLRKLYLPMDFHTNFLFSPSFVFEKCHNDVNAMGGILNWMWEGRRLI